MTKIFERHIEEELVIPRLQECGWRYVLPADADELRGITSDSGDYENVVMWGVLRERMRILNPSVSAGAIDTAISKIKGISTENVVASNKLMHDYLVNGVNINIFEGGEERGEIVRLIDYSNISNNDFVVTNQTNIKNGRSHKIPDVILYINGLPLVLFELKNPADQKADLPMAHQQVNNYVTAIPQLFVYNAVTIIGDGHQARVGTFTSPLSRYLAWKSRDGDTKMDKFDLEVDVLIDGMLKPEVFLDLLKSFIVYENSETKVNGISKIAIIKKVAAYHQYYAVNKAIESTIVASSDNGDGKAGVVWHTQGSGKSLSMVFYAGKIIQALNNPTLVILTDRNDLDEQLFDTFTDCKDLMRQTPVRASGRDELKKLLNTTGGGVIFTTIQKFAEGGSEPSIVNTRKNIVVIADEAHRSQYGFKGKEVVQAEEVITKYGLAKYMRDCLPSASYIGFTGTPISQKDADTRNVFGDYIDIYDIEQAVVDGATVKIYYESRLAKIKLNPEAIETMDDEISAISEDEENSASQAAKAKWTQIEAIVGHKERIAELAKDFVSHFEERQLASEGKAMYVAMSRRIAVLMYAEIIKIRPHWHSDDLDKGAIKVVMTSSSSDPAEYQPHHTNKSERTLLANRLKDPNDELKIVIVRDMWLTGFDAPVLNTLYIDKPMNGHGLMQAIARVNRVYKDKQGGLIVDYIGIAGNLNKALNEYTTSGGKGEPTADINRAADIFTEKLEVVRGILSGIEYDHYYTLDTRAKLQLILRLEDYILGGEEDLLDRFKNETLALSRAFGLAVPHPDVIRFKDELALYEALRARLKKFEPGASGADRDIYIETAIRQIVDDAVSSDGVISVFDAAGVETPEISIFSDEFLAQVKALPHKNLAAELLKKLIQDQVRSSEKTNILQAKKLSEMLLAVINKYHNGMLSSVELVEELINISKSIIEDEQEMKDSGMSYEERAFYDAISSYGEVKKVMDDRQLREITLDVLESVRSNISVDWQYRESARARLRIMVKKALKKHNYPPEGAEYATETILKQAALFAQEELTK